MLTAAIVFLSSAGSSFTGRCVLFLRKRFRLMLTLEQFSVKTLFGWKAL
jgi:hypothetical protein